MCATEYGVFKSCPIPKGEGLETLNIIEEPLFNRNQQLRLNLLREGHCLLTYITGIQPSLASLRCYYKTVIKHYGGIPGRFCLIPFRIRTLGLLLEPFRGTSDLTSLSKRLELAYHIASLLIQFQIFVLCFTRQLWLFRTIAFFWALKLEALAVGIRFFGESPMAKIESIVVVGSGPTGVSAAIPLVEAGYKVTLVESAKSIHTNFPKPTRTMAEYRGDKAADLTNFQNIIESLIAEDSHSRSPKLAYQGERDLLRNYEK